MKGQCLQRRLDKNQGSNEQRDAQRCGGLRLRGVLALNLAALLTFALFAWSRVF